MSPHRATEEKEIQDISMTSIGKKTNQTDYYHTILPPEVTGGVRAIASTPQDKMGIWDNRRSGLACLF